jgi:hypothetical protein
MADRPPRGVIEVDGCRLTLAEADVLRLLATVQWIAVAPNAWGSFEILSWLAWRRLVLQCGRLFRLSGAGDRVAAKLPPHTADLFEQGRATA